MIEKTGRDSYRRAEPHVASVAITPAYVAFDESIAGIERDRERIRNEMRAVVEAFYRDRDAAIRQQAGNDYIGLTLTLSVNDAGSATPRWAVLHSRNGKQSKPTSFRVNTSLQTIKQRAPEVLHAAIEVADQKLRTLRRQLAQLGRVLRALKLAAKVDP